MPFTVKLPEPMVILSGRRTFARLLLSGGSRCRGGGGGIRIPAVTGLKSKTHVLP
jgi:hypothetical protein